MFKKKKKLGPIKIVYCGFFLFFLFCFYKGAVEQVTQYNNASMMVTRKKSNYII